MNKSLTWQEVKNRLKVGDIVEGAILRHEQYGMFVDLGCCYEGLVSITDFKDEGKVTPDQYPSIGERVSAVVLGFRDVNHQIWLGMKRSQLGLHQLGPD